jgi:hypothetical protein
MKVVSLEGHVSPPKFVKISLALPGSPAAVALADGAERKLRGSR